KDGRIQISSEWSCKQAERSGAIEPRACPGVSISELAAFVKSGWNTTKLARYYRSPKKLYTTTVAVPPLPSPLAPTAFGEPDNEDFCWMVHYRGKLVHKDGIRFRFVGNGDDILVVAVNGKTVMNGSRGWDRDTSPLGRLCGMAPFFSG
ncbi:hypothetical protein P4E94_16695, partial [Pontiellaceae bacterium B12219]|nr:hypothetical protein [Pontiellaceae bacterium B12219]